MDTGVNQIPKLFLFSGSLVAVLLSASAAYADEKAELEKLLPQWKEAWNAKDVPRMVKLMDPADKSRKIYERDDEGRQKATKGFGELIDLYGKIEKFEVRKFIQAKNRFVVRITYARKGMVPGTFAAAKGPDDQWVLSVDVDGQGEPELQQ